MDSCPICEHAKTEAIDASITRGTHLAVVSCQFRVTIEALAGHLAHQSLTRAGNAPQPSMERLSSLVSTHDVITTIVEPMTLFKQAWELAKDDERMRQRMVAFVQEQLIQDDMGLS